MRRFCVDQINAFLAEGKNEHDCGNGRVCVG